MGFKIHLGVGTAGGGGVGEIAMGFELHHGVRNHGLRNASGGGGQKEGVCLILYWSANATQGALRAMAGQASLPALLCGPSSPNMHAATREGEGEDSLLVAPTRVSLFSTEHGSGNGMLCALGLHRLLLGGNFHL